MPTPTPVSYTHLMYLRLRGGGMFYKVLNTPARIEVIEKMGHLDREDRCV